MRFPYWKEPASPSGAHPDRKGILRPRIPVRLRHKANFIDLLALVDSGADDCLFPMEVAHLLSLDLDATQAHRYGGIGEGEVVGIFGNVTLEVGGSAFPLYAGFADAPSIVPILGQNGFFSLFEVRFNLSKERLELEPVRKAR
jgi:hypothetical protein